jgi:hypothetical protein
MDFPAAFAALQNEMKWKRATIVWEDSETFSHYNFASLEPLFEDVGAEIHQARQPFASCNHGGLYLHLYRTI